MAGFTFEAANLRLETATSTQDIIDILNEISIDSPGSKTVLYSGMSSKWEWGSGFQDDKFRQAG
jgi:hypothetical protein